MARGTIASLRHQIAKIEGRLAERLDEVAPDIDQDIDLVGMAACRAGIFSSPEPSVSTRLWRGLPGAGLTEIHAPITRDAGSAAAFVLALVRLVLKPGRPMPVGGNG